MATIRSIRCFNLGRQLFRHSKTMPALVSVVEFHNNKFTNYGNNNCDLWKPMTIRFLTTGGSPPSPSNESCDDPPKKLSLYQRFKQMYKDYWYVLLPVHLVTSAAWFGGFYYMAKSGFDVASYLEHWGVSDKIVNPLKDSSMGYVAIAYALYKIATPLRYTVTLGGTTVSIKYLVKYGYIKPVPSKEELKTIYEEKRDSLLGKKDILMESIRETKEELKQRKDQIKERRDHIAEDYARFKQEMKTIKESTKTSK